MELWDSLTDEQKQKAKACTSAEELMQYAGEEGIELPSEVLDGIAGGYVFLNQRYRYEVIRDSDGEVLEDGYLSLQQAQEAAVRLGQNPREITWDELDDLRGC